MIHLNVVMLKTTPVDVDAGCKFAVMIRFIIFVALLKVILAKVGGRAAFDDIININENAKSTFSVAVENNMPELFEGDIVRTRSLDIDIENMEYAAKNKISKFDAMNNKAWRGGVIPYTFDSRFSSRGRQVVRQAIADYNRYTCIKFVPRTSQRSYVTFFHGGGCYSMIGQVGGPQRISLASPGCLTKGVAIHELMHCAGFFHEQSRLDRDRYIYVNFANIRSGVSYNFKKYRYGEASTLGASYDKKSVMHYGNYAFSKNGRKTITSRSNPNERLGQRAGFSKIDIQQLNAYYKCSGTGKPKPTTPTSTCSDGFLFCKALSGYCSHAWVMKNCRKTCRRCSTTTKPRPKPKPKCKDLHRNCRNWARGGYCRSRNSAYRGYMKAKCAKSCGFCR